MTKPQWRESVCSVYACITKVGACQHLYYEAGVEPRAGKNEAEKPAPLNHLG